MGTKANLTTLLNKIRQGDDEAITILIRDYRRLVIHAIRLALEPGNSQRPFITTKDIMQLVNKRLVRMSNKAKQQDPPIPPEEIKNGWGFLVKIASRLVIDQSRKGPNGRRRKKNGDEHLNIPPLNKIEFDADLTAVLIDHDANPEKQTDERDLCDFFLSQLADDDRQVAELLMQGHKYNEIVDKAEVSRVSRRMQRQFRQIEQSFRQTQEG